MFEASLLLDYLPAPSSTSAEAEAQNLVSWMTRAADRCIPRRRPGPGRPPVPWWNHENDALRSECLKARRVFQRKRARHGESASQEYQDIWKGLRKTLSIAIKEAKEKAWADLIASVDSDPWGKPYKIVTKRLRRSRPITGLELPGRLDDVVNALFPCGNPPTRVPSTTCSTVWQTEFTTIEIVGAAHSLPNGKAPGPDGIQNELFKSAASCDPRRFQTVLNRC